MIEGSEKVFSLPEVFYRLQTALNDPDKTFDDFGDIISHDPALSARLLRIVNSPFYGLSSKVETITHALTIIGLDQLVDLAMATSVIYQFRGIPNTLFNMESFWKHSIACGLAARTIGQVRGEENVERLYLAGILHDLGRLVIYIKEPTLARDAFYRSKEKEENIHLSEQAIMGFDHAEVGGELLRSWQLPESLAQAVACHHEPGKSDRYQVDAAIVHTADYIVHDMNIAKSEEFYVPVLDAKTWERIEIDPKTLAEKISDVQDQFEQTLKMFL